MVAHALGGMQRLPLPGCLPCTHRACPIPQFGCTTASRSNGSMASRTLPAPSCAALQRWEAANTCLMCEVERDGSCACAEAQAPPSGSKRQGAAGHLLAEWPEAQPPSFIGSFIERPTCAHPTMGLPLPLQLIAMRLHHGNQHSSLQLQAHWPQSKPCQHGTHSGVHKRMGVGHPSSISGHACIATKIIMISATVNLHGWMPAYARACAC